MSYDLAIKNFLSEEIQLDKYFYEELIIPYLKSILKNATILDILTDLGEDKKSLEKLKEELVDKWFLEHSSVILPHPSAQNAITNKSMLIGNLKTEKIEKNEESKQESNQKKTENMIAYLKLEKLEDLNSSIFENKNLKKYISKGICIVCNDATEIIPMNVFLSASTLTNPYNFEFGNYEKFSYGLCKKHIHRALWFYLLDIFPMATPSLALGNYRVKILLYLKNLNVINQLLRINLNLYNELLKNGFYTKNLVNFLNNLKREINRNVLFGNLFLTIFSYKNKKIVIHRTYNIYTIDSWLNYIDKHSDYFDNILNIMHNLKISGEAYLEIFDMIFQKRPIGNLQKLKRLLYEFFRDYFFKNVYRGKKRNLANIKSNIKNIKEIINYDGKSKR